MGLVIKISCLLLGLLWHGSVLAKDFGKQGATFVIKEEGFVSMMQRKLQMVDIAKHQQEMQDVAERRVRQPVALDDITRASRTMVHHFDPTYVLGEDVWLPSGELLYARGTSVNPLDHLQWAGKMVFIDGRDQSQIAWLKDNYCPVVSDNNDNISDSGEKLVSEALESPSNLDEVKIILTGGRPLELEQEVGRPIYFDQAAELTGKFNIRHVPAIVEQEGKQLRITELNIDGK